MADKFDVPLKEDDFEEIQASPRAKSYLEVVTNLHDNEFKDEDKPELLAEPQPASYPEPGKQPKLKEFYADNYWWQRRKHWKTKEFLHPVDRWNYDPISMWEKFSYCWVSPLIHFSQKGTVDQAVLPQISRRDEAAYLTNKFEKAWALQVDKYGEKEASVMWVFYEIFKSRFWTTFIFHGLETAGTLVQAYFIGELVGSVSSGASAATCYGWAAAVSLMAFLIGAVLHHIAFMNGWRLGQVCQTVSLGFIYRKTLRVSQQGLSKVSSGHVTNLVTNDSERFQQAAIFVHFLVVGPLLLTGATVLIWGYVGWPAIFGPLLCLIISPLFVYLGRLAKSLRQRTANITDERVKKMSELLKGMRVIKMNNWEAPLHNVINEIRKKELKLIRTANWIKAFTQGLNFVTVGLASFVIFLPYTLLGNDISAQTVFLVIAVFNGIRFPVSVGLPSGINSFAELSIVFRRYKAFLLLEEVPARTKDTTVPAAGDSVITMRHADCVWSENLRASQNFSLHNISVTVKTGELVMIVGPVGCGKTSLMMAMLGEMKKLAGSISLNGSIGYCPQESWILNESVKDNILFGAKLNSARFAKVVEVCQLEDDFAKLSQGENTLIGERGVNLSGGQKARISLARSIYHRPDVVLLDDPLSAVDPHVARKLFELCICDELSGCTRVLVTHQIQFAAAADKIIVMGHGSIIATGTFSELKAAGVSLSGTAFDVAEREKSDRSRTESERLRTTSISSVDSMESQQSETATVKAPSAKGESIQKELRTEGTITVHTYIEYFKNSGGVLYTVSFSLLFLAAQAAEMGVSYYLSWWAEENYRNHTIDVNTTAGDVEDEARSDLEYLSSYAGIVGALVVLGFGRVFLFMNGSMRASRELHAKVVNAVMHVPINFIDTNPIGRIINRFSKDTGYVDDLLPITFLDFLQGALVVASVTVVTTVLNYWTIFMTVPLVYLFFWLRKYYLRSSRDVKRLEGTLRSPLYSMLNSSMAGLITIRSRCAEGRFVNTMVQLQNDHAEAYFAYLVSSRWLGFRLDMLGFLFIGTVTFAAIAVRDELGVGTVGLSLVYVMSLTGLFQWVVRQSAEVENQMTSVERMVEYSKLASEETPEQQQQPPPDPSWPSAGAISFQDLSMKYRVGGADALRNISLEIQSKEKIGVVGRTGAGKSSLLAALFRLSHNSGKIIIDGVDIATIPLSNLRSKISVIPQEPVLFSGTIRMNIDPFQFFDDRQIWAAVENVQIKELLSLDGLDTYVSEDGGNFSVGQRQLICMARALLQPNKILILDEATANIDQDTDRLIQQIIRSKFTDWTVLTIAHRLNTILDSDKILVMDKGTVEEFDTPKVLLANKRGLLSKQKRASQQYTVRGTSSA